VIDARGTCDAAAAAASLHTKLRIATDPARRGPVPLARLLDEFNLLHVTMPQLTRAGIAEYLLGEGIMPGDLMDTGDPDETFSGFLFKTGTDGVVFVAEMEPVISESVEKPRLRPTPLGRWRYTAAHELGHFLLHQERMIGGRWIGDTKETIREGDGPELTGMEREADQFAAELLMPADVCRARAEAFRAAYRVCPLTAFAYHLSSELLVSPEAMRNRLGPRGLGVCDE
jgi:hypothetical protein